MPEFALSTEYATNTCWLLAALSDTVKSRFAIVPWAPSDTLGESIDTDT